MIGWQPIETAPRDGQPFLAWCPSTGLCLMRIVGIKNETWSPSFRHPEPTVWMRPEPPR